MKRPRKSTPKSIRDYYDEFSRTYDQGRDAGYHALVDKLETEIALRYMRGRVLEVGCGTGLILNRLGAAATQAIGIDLSRGMLAHAHARGLTVLRASATALPFRNGAFQTVCSFKVLSHVPAIETATAEVSRVLVPAGHAVLEFYNRQSLRYLAFRLRRGAISAETSEKDVFVRYDLVEDMRRYLPQTLRVVDWRGVRIVTPAAALLRIPLLGSVLRVAERWATRSPLLARLGGFAIIVAKRVS